MGQIRQDVWCRAELQIGANLSGQAKSSIAGADSNGGVLTNNTRYYVYGLYPPWTRHTMEVAMGLRVHVVSMSRVRLYLPRSRRHDYPEVKAWIKHNAPLHVRATLYLERRR